MCVCMYVCMCNVACWVRLSYGAWVECDAPFSCACAQTRAHEEGRGKKGREREGDRETSKRQKRVGEETRRRKAAPHSSVSSGLAHPSQGITRALDRRRSLMRSRQPRARRARTPSSSRTSRPPPPLPWLRSLSSPTPPAPTTTSRPPPRCVRMRVCVGACARARAKEPWAVRERQIHQATTALWT